MELFFQTALGTNDGVLGMIMVIHTFGDYARFHPHLHAIVAEGLFRPDVIERILGHLELWKQHPPPYDMETKAPANGPAVIEDFDEGWPRYEEPVIVYH
jgi:hypothetical protein